MPSENALIFLLFFSVWAIVYATITIMPRNISSLIKKYLSTYYVLVTAPGIGCTMVKNIDIVFAFIMFIFFCKRSQVIWILGAGLFSLL